MIQLQSYVLGGWSKGQAPFRDLVNPATDERVAQASSNGLDMAAVMDHARTVGGPSLRAMSFEERGAMLRTWSKALYAAREALLDVTMVNAGSTRGDAKFDVDGATGTLSYYAGLGKKLGDRKWLVDGESEQLTRNSARFYGMHIRVPIQGAAVHIGAFNFPAWGTFAFAGAEDETHGAFVSSTKTIQPGQTEELNFQIYAGQRNIQTLADLGSDLDQAVNLGFFGFFARWLLKYLIWIHSLVGNWGLAIVLLTVSVKVLFLPLTKKSFESSQKMQALQPQVQELKAKYENDPQRAGQEQMKLFQKEGVNPMSGCLPMLIQMPVWFALFTVLLYTAELFHADFLIWKDLSVVDPFAILPAIVGTMMLLQQRMTPTSPGMDPNQARMMKLMPLIFVFFYFTFPAGLAIYSTTNITLSLLQMWVIRRRLAKPPPGAPATLAAK